MFEEVISASGSAFDEGKGIRVLAFLKSARRPPSNTAISNLCSINVGSLLLIRSLYFFFLYDWAIFIYTN